MELILSKMTAELSQRKKVILICSRSKISWHRKVSEQIAKEKGFNDHISILKELNDNVSKNLRLITISEFKETMILEFIDMVRGQIGDFKPSSVLLYATKRNPFLEEIETGFEDVRNELGTNIELITF